MAEARLDALDGDLATVRRSGHLPDLRPPAVGSLARARRTARSTRCFALAAVLLIAAIIVAVV